MTPGPTRVPERVRRAGARPMIHHRDSEFSKLLLNTLEGLRPLFGTSGDVLPIHATGRGAMEASICNLLSPGNEVIVCANGRFGEMWARIAEAFDLVVHRVSSEWGRADLTAIEDALEINPKSKALLLVHSETSTGVLNDMASLARTARRHELLVMVDCVSSLGGVPVCFDEWDIDVAVTASQKCLMSSPGMSFVALSARAWKANQFASIRRSYFDFAAIRQALDRPQPETAGTAPVHLLSQVNEALAIINEEGLNQVFARHEQMGRMVRDWANAHGFSVQHPSAQAFTPTLTALRVPDGLNAESIREGLKCRGILTARGLGEFAGKCIRIGHMGDIRPQDVQQTLDALSEVATSVQKNNGG